MKRKITAVKVLAAAFICTAVLIAASADLPKLMTDYADRVKLAELSAITNTDLTSGEFLSKVDTRGFHGDGYRLRKIGFGAETGENIKKSEMWRKLPLSENVSAFLYQPCDAALDFPRVENGYYLFINNAANGNEDPYSDRMLFDRASFNFTLAVYDRDEHILYILDYDT